VATAKNPADLTSRGCWANELMNEKWRTGPEFLPNLNLTRLKLVLMMTPKKFEKSLCLPQPKETCGQDSTGTVTRRHL